MPTVQCMSTKLLIPKFAVTLQLQLGGNVNYKVNAMMEAKIKLWTVADMQRKTLSDCRVARHAMTQRVLLGHEFEW